MFIKCLMFAVPTVCPPVRLAGGNSENEGRVEIYYNNTWGTVCAGGHWDQINSNTVCKQLGYERATRYYSSPFIDHGNVPIWMDRVNCGTNDLCLGNCAFNIFGINNCVHQFDVFVSCAGIHTADIIGIGLLANTSGLNCTL